MRRLKLLHNQCFIGRLFFSPSGMTIILNGFICSPGSKESGAYVLPQSLMDGASNDGALVQVTQIGSSYIVIKLD